ncbi:MAG: ABC transporter ATP-binding protein/permease [Candidatus Heimdallarchaeota archaeon]|nr:ABC transporter ATP-binding protein/permease [Candidatus Heimdallarchaeota archaeon]
MSPEIRWIGSYLRKYKIMTITTIIGSIIEIILFSLPPLFVAKFVELFIVNATTEEFILWVMLFLLTITVQSILFYFMAIVNEYLAHRVTTDMTADLFTSLQNQTLQYHDNIRSGDIMARATGDTRILNIGLSPALRFLNQIVFAIIFTIGVLLYVNFKLSIILLFISPLYAYFIYTYAKKLGPYSDELQTDFSKVSIHAAESLSGIREIKSFNWESEDSKLFGKLSSNHSQSYMKFHIASAYFYPGLVIHLALALTTIFGVVLLINNELTFPELVIFLSMISHILWISGGLQWMSSILSRNKSSARRLMDMIFADNYEKQGVNIFDGKNASIEFKDVYFRYSETSNYVLTSINLRIESGETVAIVGGPGSGKSTLNKLILNLYKPTLGQVLIGGKEIQSYTNESIRSQISSIEQDIFLFSDTILANISFGNPEASFSEILDSAKIANVLEFVDKMAEKFETRIGERGVRLSGGQKQRIAIARALLLNPSILIMDDASSSLDAETEYNIQKAIQNVIKTRTSIIITHRLSILAEADRVIVLEKGQIVANGTHDNLLRNSIYYRRLFEEHYHLQPLEGGI